MCHPNTSDTALPEPLLSPEYGCQRVSRSRDSLPRDNVENSKSTVTSIVWTLLKKLQVRKLHRPPCIIVTHTGACELKWIKWRQNFRKIHATSSRGNKFKSVETLFDGNDTCHRQNVSDCSTNRREDIRNEERGKRGMSFRVDVRRYYPQEVESKWLMRPGRPRWYGFFRVHFCCKDRPFARTTNQISLSSYRCTLDLPRDVSIVK